MDQLSIFDDTDCLADIYALESYHFSIVKDSVRVKHMQAVNEYPEIVTEAFSDIITKMGGFFKKMANAIKEFFKKAFMFIAVCFQDIDKFTKKYKAELDKVDDVNFEIDGYKFTLDKKPDISEFERIVADYNSEISNIGEYKSTGAIAKIQNEYLDKKNLAKIRRDIIGKDCTDEDEYAEVARKSYRNGSVDKETITVDTQMFKATVSDAERISKGKKEAEKLQTNMISLLGRTEAFFSHTIPKVYSKNQEARRMDRINMDANKGSFSASSKDSITTSVSVDILNAFTRYKYNQVHAISGYINIAIREYVNAYKDQVKQARAIIKGGLTKKSEPEKDTEKKGDEG